ncbi:MAG: energy-coupled thiamine transporter ThiT [Lachnospiraceae bacterium]|nr:energy-coupled thiamine transporter ThiT [Lachnospiraceae bacterium]
MKEKLITDSFYDNENLWCAVLLALATILSFFPILVLEDGGSWTFFSLLPLWLITYFFGFRTGLVGSFLFTILKFMATFVSEVVLAGALSDPASTDMVKNSFIKGPTVFLLEYMIACTGFCLGGLLSKNRACSRYIAEVKAMRCKDTAKDEPFLTEMIISLIKNRSGKNVPEKEDSFKETVSLSDEYKEYPIPVQIYGDIDKENTTSGLIIGYLIGVFVMLVCYILAAPYYDAYPEGVVTAIDKLIYDIKYDGSYLLAEAATTVMILCIPPLRRIIFKLKHIANNPKEDPTVNSY